VVTYVLIGVVVLIVLAVVFVATRSSEFVVSRSVEIAGPAGKVFEQVNVTRNWENWSPWHKVDPAMKLTYEGPAGGEGAIYLWDGNRDVGAGKMTITESVEGRMVRTRLDFYRPFKGMMTSEILLQEEGGRTQVKWSTRGEKNFMAKVMHLVINMDTMIGGQFEKGLAELKRIGEER
jgi:hypothetical protein